MRPVRQAHDRAAPACPLLRPGLHPQSSVCPLGGSGTALQGGEVVHSGSGGGGRLTGPCIAGRWSVLDGERQALKSGR